MLSKKLNVENFSGAVFQEYIERLILLIFLNDLYYIKFHKFKICFINRIATVNIGNSYLCALSEYSL